MKAHVLINPELKALEAGEYYWVEFKPNELHPMGQLFHLQLENRPYGTDGRIILDIITPSLCICLSTDQKCWRIWSSKPTDEQRWSEFWRL